jgi:hypothetical protein
MNRLREQDDADRHESDRLAREKGTRQESEEKHSQQAGKTKPRKSPDDASSNPFPDEAS